jgi:hypothetical protein
MRFPTEEIRGKRYLEIPDSIDIDGTKYNDEEFLFVIDGVIYNYDEFLEKVVTEQLDSLTIKLNFSKDQQDDIKTVLIQYKLETDETKAKLSQKIEFFLNPTQKTKWATLKDSWWKDVYSKIHDKNQGKRYLLVIPLDDSWYIPLYGYTEIEVIFGIKIFTIPSEG